MPDLDPVFTELRAIMEPYKDRLQVKTDSETALYLDTTHVMKNKTAMFFGSVQMKKAHVSYHLMPVYVDPSLLDGMSSELRKRMQGKSCFNFTRVDPALVEELARLTRAGFDSFERQGFV